jgi:uncharacterized phage protein (TIGR01671 family)
MTRQIKFRGKRIDNGKWLYGNYIQVGDHEYIYPFEDLEPDGHHLVQISDKPHLVIPETVGQFTGLTDRNGKEVYEDDILEFTFFYYGEKEIEVCKKGIIDFEDSSFVFSVSKEEVYYFSNLYFDSESDIEVIGNIHDNKDLITSI